MKQRMICLLLALLCYAPAFTAPAAADAIKLVFVPDKQVSMAFPEDYIIYARNDTELDPRLSAAGVTLDMLQQMMEQVPGLRLYAFPPDLTCDINVVINDVDFDDPEAQQSVLQSTSSHMELQLRLAGIAVLSTEVSQAGENYFMIFRYRKPDGVYCLHYQTIAQGQTFAFVLASSDPLSDEDEAVMKTIAEYSVFTRHSGPLAGKAPAAAEKPGYYDSELGLRFAFPDGWEQQPLSQQRQTIDIKIIPAGNVMCNIFFGKTDLFTQLTAAEKVQMGISSRESADALAEDPAYLASLLGLGENQYEVRRYAGMNFVVGTMPMGDGLETQFAVTIRQGYMVLFQKVDLTHEYQDALYTVLDSVTLD